MHMKLNFKRLMVMFLSIMMVVGMLPTMVFAEDEAKTVNFAAQIGDTDYLGLQEAINAAQDNDTIKMIADITLTETVTIPEGKTITLDLAGYTISGVDTKALYSLVHVENGAELTIKDSSTDRTGMITYDAGSGDQTGAAVFVEGKLTLESGTIELTGDWSFGFAVDVHPNAWGTVYTEPTNFTMNGGKIVASDSGVRVANYSAANSAVSATFTMNGGEIETASDGIFVQHVNACDLDVAVTKGTIKSGTHAIRIYGDTVVNDVDVTISGGSFTGDLTNLDKTGDGKTAISGGTFINADPSEWAAEGYKAVESNGTWTVSKAPAVTNVAQIGETQYESIQAAVNAAKDDDTVKLIADIITLSETVTVPAGKTITLDLNGKTISGVDTKALYSLVHVENGADLTIEDSTNSTGKITYAAGSEDKTGAAVFVEGKLTLTSGTIELTDDWSIGFAVDVHPNAWGTVYTEPTNFTMDGGKIVASDSGVRVANYSAANSAESATFTMNDGEIKTDSDGIFVQHVNACDLDVVVTNGTIKGGNHAIRIYGDVVNDVDVTISGGSFTGNLTNLDNTGNGKTAISGGTFDNDPTDWVAEGYKAVESNGTWTVAEDKGWYDPDATEYIINNAEELKAFAAAVTAGDTFEGKTVKLAADIDLYAVDADGERVTFTPIGNKAVFEGTFDGQNHTISNMYQNGWALGYDWYNYGSVGLFSEIKDATIKNLTLEGAECLVEGGDVGGITGSATGTCVFENITIKDSTFATYNNGCGSIIAWSGAGNYTFKNITIESDVTLAGLWGSFDSSIGGIVGQGEPGATYNFENVDIACRLDVYNDCTASHDYYIYRMCGMIIGRLEKTTNIDGTNYPDMSQYNITCDDVTVTYGDWMNYHYCEPTPGYNNGRGMRVEPGYSYDALPADYDHSQCTTNHNTLIPFDQLFGGDQFGVKGLPTYEGVTVIYPSDDSADEVLATLTFEGWGGTVEVNYPSDQAETLQGLVDFYLIINSTIGSDDTPVITLYGDVTGMINTGMDSYGNIYGGADWTLELNGHTLNGMVTVDSDTTLTVQDSVGGGKIGGDIVGIDNYGTVTVKGGTVSGEVNGIYNNGEAIAYIEGGVITSEAVADFVVNAGIYNENGVVNVTGGEVYVDIINEEGTAVLSGGTFDKDYTDNDCNVTIADGCKSVDNGDGTWTVTDDYVEWIKAQLLAGNNVTLEKDIVVDGTYIDSIPATTNSNGKYPNYGIFNVYGDTVTFDLNGYSITYNGHENFEWNGKTYNSCEVAHGLFMANDGGKLTIVDGKNTGKVDVHGVASGVYSCSPNSVITVEGGTWTNDGCATCDGTNLFLYASHGGELYIKGGTFKQNADPSYLIVEHGGEYKNAVIDFSKTKIEITGGTFVGMNPEDASYFFADADNKTTYDQTTNVVANGYEAIDNGNDSWTVKKVEEEKLWSIDSSNIVLGNELAMWFYVANENLDGTDYVAVVTKSYADGRDNLVVEIPYSEWKSTDDNHMRFKFNGIAAKEMSDNISVVVKTASTEKAVSNVYNDSIRGYVERGFANGNAQKDTKLATLLVDMLNYGAAAQGMFNYGESDLANKNMTEYQNYATQSVTCENKQVQGTGYKSVSLTLESNISFNMRFDKTYVTEDMTAVVTFIDHYDKLHSIEITGDKFEPDGNYWKIAVEELVPADFSQIVTCTFINANGNIVEGVSGSDSMESFCARAIAGNGGSWYEDIAKFMTSAYEYFHQ